MTESTTRTHTLATSGARLDISQRLESLKALKDGWAGGTDLSGRREEGHGKAPSSEGIDWLAGRFLARYASDLPRPYLYPTPEGGIQAEWSVGANEASLEIDLDAHAAEWHCLNLNTSRADERTVSLDDDSAWEWLVTELRRLATMAQ